MVNEFINLLNSHKTKEEQRIIRSWLIVYDIILYELEARITDADCYKLIDLLRKNLGLSEEDV